MDREQEQLKHFGFFGIFGESFKLTFSWPKIFSQITLSLVLPLCFLFLANSHISILIFNKNIEVTFTGVGILAFNIAYFVLVSILSLLATSAVAYAIACLYTCNDIMTFKKVMSVVPKVWKRLLVTYLVGFLLFVVYHVVAVGVFFLWVVVLRLGVIGIVTAVVFLILYSIGLVYFTIVWNLANVMSILEEVKGFKALKKSRILIKGKIVVSVFILIVVSICLGGIQALFVIFVVQARMYPSVGIRVAFAILCLLLMTMVVLLSFVIQAVTYFVCKSYHHESIEGSSLLNHLPVMNHGIGGHVPLNAANKDVQLEQLPV